MTELLPCPFCGGEAETWDNGAFWYVICKSKDCAAMSSPCFTEAEAIAAWNTRTDDYRRGFEDGLKANTRAAFAAAKQAIPERTCKHERMFNLVERECDGKRYSWRDMDMPNYCPNCGAKVVGE